MTDFNDDVLGKRLIHQIAEEVRANQASDAAFWVVVATTGLALYMRQFGGCRPAPEQIAYARFVCTMLNRRYRFGGAWVIAWCEPRNQVDRTPTRLVFLWKDKDGDVPIAFDTVRPLEDLVTWGPVWFCEKAEEAFEKYRGWLKGVGVKPEQMIKAALGETSADPEAAPSL